jgi:Skp family chaperone for outer membrane proteins
MKRNFAFILIRAIFTGGIVSAQAQSSTAYINMEKVFENFYKTKRSEASLKKQEAVYKERADTAIQELEALKEKYNQLRKEADSVALSDEAKERKLEGAKAVEMQLRDKDRDLQKYFADKKREMQADYMKSRNFIVKEILQFVRTYADTNGYDVVLDVSGMTQNYLPVILKYPKDKEITDIILQEINRGHENEAAETDSLELPEIDDTPAVLPEDDGAEG